MSSPGVESRLKERGERVPGGRTVWALIAPVVLLLGALLWVNWNSIVFSCERLTDYILIALNVENAREFRAWTGAYSRLGLRHPGPILFYAYAAGDWVFSFLSMPLGRFRLVQFLLNAYFVCTMVAALSAIVRVRLMALIAGIALIVLCRGSEGTSFRLLADVWNPFPAVVPTATLLATSALVATGRLSFLIPNTLAFLVVSQTHLGAAPIACAVFAAGIALAVRSRVDANGAVDSSRRQTLCALALMCLAWSPVVFEMLTQPEWGNVGEVFRFSALTPATHSIREVIELLSKSYGKVFMVSSVGASLLVWASVLIVSWLPGVLPPALRALRVLASTAMIISILTLTRTAGQMYPYLMVYHFGIALILSVLAVERVVMWGRVGNSVVRRVFSVVLLLGCLLIQAHHALGQLAGVPRMVRECPTLGGARALARQLGLSPGSEVRLVSREARLWHSLAALALVLRRQGVEVCVDRPLWFVFDSSMVCSPDLLESVRTVTMYDVSKGFVPKHGRVAQVGNVAVFWREFTRAKLKRRKSPVVSFDTTRTAAARERKVVKRREGRGRKGGEMESSGTRRRISGKSTEPNEGSSRIEGAANVAGAR